MIIYKKKYPFFKVHDKNDSAPACIKMIAKYYGKLFSIQHIRNNGCFNPGYSLSGICNSAKQLGLRTRIIKIDYNTLRKNIILPAIIEWKHDQYVVIYKITSKYVIVSDPATSIFKLKVDELQKSWKKNSKCNLLNCIQVQTTPNFYTNYSPKERKISIWYFFNYLKPYKKFFIQLILGSILGSLFSLIIPFLSQSVIDIGIGNSDISFIYTVLIAQMVILLSQSSVGFIRSWILLHISTRLSISIVSDFFVKLMDLPIKFFDTRKVGDVLQRVGDNGRIQSLLTSATLSTIFSIFNFFVYCFVLGYYNIRIFTIFIIGKALHTLWIYLFMNKRRELDFRRFDQSSSNQSSLVQLINGMQEIKLNNYEDKKRWEWENIQSKLFTVSVDGLKLQQIQSAGAMLLDQSKNILISIFSATEVINGNLTLGMLVAIQYIVGQLSSPINQLVGFMHTLQDAKISLERLGEVHTEEAEENSETSKIHNLLANININIKDLSFSYQGTTDSLVLENINLSIPSQKITAIVGPSGSGKTTLIKLILGFYKPTTGKITINDISVDNYSKKQLRDNCGVVMQNGFIFSDTIMENIIVGDDNPDMSKIIEATENANINEFIESLPDGLFTVIGSGGVGLSYGQKQRILIARAIYKNPLLVIFDEATNSLDSNNEKKISDNLKVFMKGKTGIIIAHRLSTVRNADQIIVLEKGKIIETGNHETLVNKRGFYYSLVKNQLELGN